MPLDQLELQKLLERVRSGDEEAARELLQHFEPHVRRVVRSRLPQTMRSRFDSMDFVQSVWGDFFPKLRGGDIAFDTPQQLAQFLTRVALGKVSKERRRQLQTDKRDWRREVPLDREHNLIPVASSDPTPSQTAAAHDRLEAMLRGRPALHQKVLQMRSQGFTFAEIAAHTGIDERTARRIVHGIEKELGLDHAGQ